MERKMFLITVRRIVGPPVAFCWERPLFSPVCRDHGRIHTQNLSGLLEVSALVASSLAFNRYVQDLIFLWAIFTLIDCYACPATWIWLACWKRLLFERENLPHGGVWGFYCEWLSPSLSKGHRVGHLRQWGHRRPGTPWESRDPQAPHASVFSHIK